MVTQVPIMKTTFLFTIDVESKTEGDPNEDVLGRIRGYAGNFGIELMMDLLEQRHVRGTFFLNAYEIARHGESVMANAARLIHSRGHDIELHTHPRPMYRFYGMNGASLDEQVAILEKGISLIRKWTGKTVIAHRAGAFEANMDTLRAWKRQG